MDFVHEMYVLGGEEMNLRDELRGAMERMDEAVEHVKRVQHGLEDVMCRRNDLNEKKRVESPKTAPKRKLCCLSGLTDPKTGEVLSEHMHLSDTSNCTHASLNLIKFHFEKVTKLEAKKHTRKQMEEAIFSKK
jgi:hypothetical protein